MSLRPSGLGAEPKKLGTLVGLLVLAGRAQYWASRADGPAGTRAIPTPLASTVKTPAAPATVGTSSGPRTTASSYGPRPAARGRTSASGDDFRPTLKVPE